MKWFIQGAALGLFALFGAQTLFGQTNTATGRSGVGTQQEDVKAQGTATGQLDPLVETPNRRDANRRGSGYYPDNNEPWFANEDLRNELELDDDQIERLRELYRESRGELEVRGQGEDLADAARAERMRELRNRFDDEFSNRSSGIFRNDAQRNRFNQLNLQYRGYSAFDNPRLQRDLNLNDTQRRQLQELNNSWNTELEQLRGSYVANPADAENRFNQLRDRTRTNFEGILNDQQRTAYDEMIGNRFDFGANAYLGGTTNNQQGNPNNPQEGTGNQGSLLGTQQEPGTQGSGIGTPQDNDPQGSGIGTPSGAAGGTGGTGGAGASGSGTSGTSGSGN